MAPSDVQRALRLFHRDGFVVIRDALTSDQVVRLRNKCEELADDILRNDKNRLVKAEKILTIFCDRKYGWSVRFITALW